MVLKTSFGPDEVVIGRCVKMRSRGGGVGRRAAGVQDSEVSLDDGENILEPHSRCQNCAPDCDYMQLMLQFDEISFY